MPNITINDASLAELTAGQLATDDVVPVWDTSASAMKRASRVALVGATIAGGGTVNLDGKTLTVPANGTAALLEVNNVFTLSQTIPSVRSAAPLTLLDDTAVAIPLAFTALVALVAGLSLTASGMIMCRCAGTPICGIVASSAGTLLVATTGTILTGTTGTDGKMTVSAHSNGNLYVENRTGVSFALNYFVIGS